MNDDPSKELTETHEVRQLRRRGHAPGRSDAMRTYARGTLVTQQ